MKAFIPIAFQLAAIVVVMAEIVIPSFGVLTLIAVALFGYSWYYIVQSLPSIATTAFMVADIILIPICIVLGFKLFRASPLSHKKELLKGSGADTVSIIGKTGTTQTPLRPTGKALIDNKMLEVTSEVEFLEQNVFVKVTKTDGLKIIVKPIESLN